MMIKRYYFYNVRVTRNDGYSYSHGIVWYRSWLPNPVFVFKDFNEKKEAEFMAEKLYGKYEVIAFNKI